MVWYSHHFQNFPVYCDPHKGFGIVSKAEIDGFFWSSLAFSGILVYIFLDVLDLGYFAQAFSI